jgi:tRNA A-37 threonylcarbamoyl transferase component Bud32
MCLASSDPGGPRRCSGDSRAALQRAQVAVAVLEQRQATLEDRQASVAPHVDVQPAPPPPAGGAAAAPTVPEYHLWEEFNEGSYGCIRISPDGSRAVKEILPGPDGEPGQFGAHEVTLAMTMGRLGHSPRVYRAFDTHLEMDFVAGTPMWASYKPTEDESVMNAVQTRKLAAALRDLHLMGYVHGDMHVRQVLVNGDDVKLVDYGSAAPVGDRPVRALHDLNKIARLANWGNDELADDPYIRLVNKHLNRYRDIKGVSKAAHEQRDAIAEDYLRELKELP